MAEKKTNVNTAKGVKSNGVTAAQLDQELKDAAKVLKDQKQVEVNIPAYLQSRLGTNVPVAVNGAVIHVPVGKKVKIPEAMAEVLNESLNQLSL